MSTTGSTPRPDGRARRRSAILALASSGPMALALALVVAPAGAFADGLHTPAPAVGRTTTTTGATTTTSTTTTTTTAGGGTSATSATSGTSGLSGTSPTGSAGSSATPSSPLCVPSAFTIAQRTVEGALAGRVTRLNTLVSRLDASATVASSDKSTLLGEIQGMELPGIEALQAKVPGDTTCPQLRADAHAMVFEYRVYAVMTPKTDLTITNDAASTTTNAFANLEPTIAAAIRQAQAQGKNTADAQADFADFQAKVTAAGSLVGAGQSATLLAQMPAAFPATVGVFSQARLNVVNAGNDLRAARGDLTKIVKDLS
ncbi:MAG TPA: hypothetical protein VMU09_07955 [Acidimicrobiales bacterium]|nr:hypothetical protein [Acidimicrobiales bacterium]